MDKELQPIDDAIRDTHGKVRLVPYRRTTRADIQAMIDAANAAEWSGVVSHHDTLVDWNDDLQSGHIERHYITRYPSPSIEVKPLERL